MSYLHQRALLRDLFDTAVAAADPAHCLSGWLPEPPRGKLAASAPEPPKPVVIAKSTGGPAKVASKA